MTAPLLQVRGLGVSFPRAGWPRPSFLRAAHDVSFDLQAGEIVSLVGESGSGKSTIGRVLLRMQTAVAGAVALQGEAVDVRSGRGAPLRFRQRVQMVFQDPYASLNPVHRVLHHVARPLLLHGQATRSDVRQKAIALLEAVGLGPAEAYLDRYPHELSGGQRQRVAIARALAPKPMLLVADEPTASLDVSVRMEVLELLRDLQQQQGLGVLLITHDLAGARFISDRVVVLYAGQVMEQGPTRDLLSRPRHPYTRLLVAAASHLDGPLPAGPGAPPVIDPPPGCPFVARCPEASPRCHAETPAQRPLSPSHAIRCHHPLPE